VRTDSSIQGKLAQVPFIVIDNELRDA